MIQRDLGLFIRNIELLILQLSYDEDVLERITQSIDQLKTRMGVSHESLNVAEIQRDLITFGRLCCDLSVRIGSIRDRHPETPWKHLTALPSYFEKNQLKMDQIPALHKDIDELSQKIDFLKIERRNFVGECQLALDEAKQAEQVLDAYSRLRSQLDQLFAFCVNLLEKRSSPDDIPNLTKKLGQALADLQALPKPKSYFKQLNFDIRLCDQVLQRFDGLQIEESLQQIKVVRTKLDTLLTQSDAIRQPGRKLLQTRGLNDGPQIPFIKQLLDSHISDRYGEAMLKVVASISQLGWDQSSFVPRAAILRAMVTVGEVSVFMGTALETQLGQEVCKLLQSIRNAIAHSVNTSDNCMRLWCLLDPAHATSTGNEIFSQWYSALQDIHQLLQKGQPFPQDMNTRLKDSLGKFMRLDISHAPAEASSASLSHIGKLRRQVGFLNQIMGEHSTIDCDVEYSPKYLACDFILITCGELSKSLEKDRGFCSVATDLKTDLLEHIGYLIKLRNSQVHEIAAKALFAPSEMPMLCSSLTNRASVLEEIERRMQENSLIRKYATALFQTFSEYFEISEGFKRITAQFEKGSVSKTTSGFLAVVIQEQLASLVQLAQHEYADYQFPEEELESDIITLAVTFVESPQSVASPSKVTPPLGTKLETWMRDLHRSPQKNLLQAALRMSRETFTRKWEGIIDEVKGYSSACQELKELVEIIEELIRRCEATCERLMEEWMQVHPRTMCQSDSPSPLRFPYRNDATRRLFADWARPESPDSLSPGSAAALSRLSFLSSSEPPANDATPAEYSPMSR